MLARIQEATVPRRRISSGLPRNVGIVCETSVGIDPRPATAWIGPLVAAIGARLWPTDCAGMLSR